MPGRNPTSSGQWTWLGVNLSVGALLSPSWPEALSPHAQTVPSLLRARLWLVPAAIAVMPVRNPTSSGPWTWLGVNLSVGALLSPSWPEALSPHAQTVPSLLRARLWLVPAAIAVMPVRNPTSSGPWTWLGVNLSVGALLSPSWPEALSPHAQTVPSLLRARLWLVPAAIAVMPVRKPTSLGPWTWTGVFLCVVELSPTSP